MYGGLTKEEYKAIQADITEDNRKHLLFMSIVGFVPFLILGVMGFFTNRVPLGITYTIFSAVFIVIFLLSKTVAKKIPVISSVNVIIFDFLLLFVGVVAARIGGDERVTLFLPLLVVAAYIFCIRPIYLIGIVGVSEYLFILTILEVQNPDMVFVNTVNSLVFTFVSILTGIFMMGREHQRFYTNYHNVFLIERDQLTGAYNRRIYESEINRIVSMKIPSTICMLDVNGLKVVNDNLGHDAGDELIKGACDCISKVFGKMGKVCRIGGDEFSVLIETSEVDDEKVLADFNNVVNSWHGKYVEKLSVSIGIEHVKEVSEETLMEALKSADSKMYTHKAEYYKSQGMDRRGQASAHQALCNLYTKILRINLTSDSYVIVNMDNNEKLSAMGFSEKISEWLRDFGKTGQVHPDDLDEYLRLTDISFLSDYFRQGNSSITITYKRKYSDSFKQTSMEMIPADDYSDTNQSLFLYVKSVG